MCLQYQEGKKQQVILPKVTGTAFLRSLDDTITVLLFYTIATFRHHDIFGCNVVAEYY